MGLLKKLFASDPESMRKKADALFDAGDFGPAKLAYEKAAEAADEADRPALEDRVRACKDGIARQRIDEARAYQALIRDDQQRCQDHGQHHDHDQQIR